MNRFIKALLLPLALTGAACDEGDIRPDNTAATAEGFSIRLTATISGADTWVSPYRLSLAGFTDGDEYAAVVKNLDATDGEAVDITLPGITPGIATVELCVLDGLRRRVVTLASVDVTGMQPMSTGVLEAGNVDAGMFATIQHRVFSTTCANCHGASNHAAAGLYLTEGRSYGSLVGEASTVVDGALRVAPGDASSSVLYRALATDMSASWRYDHSVEIPSQSTLDMIKSWIDGGARP